ncbi:MAG: DUF1738 domain-containing protein [Novosphingobium sp.]|nr:DUF1738 domain-containing protein [Novosphingobium sp.]
MPSLFEQVTEKIIAAIEAGAGTYKMPWHSTGAARPVNVSGQPYRGINVLLLWAEAQHAGYPSAVWGTYRQWQQRGAQVQRGARSTIVLLWKPLGAPGDDQGGDENARRRFVARAFRVFNAAQVDGYEPAPTPILPEEQRIAHAEAFFASLPAQVWFGSDMACYDPRSDLISTPSFEAFRSPEAFYAVLAHEMVHNAVTRIMPHGVGQDLVFRPSTMRHLGIIRALRGTRGDDRRAGTGLSAHPERRRARVPFLSSACRRGCRPASFRPIHDRATARSRPDRRHGGVGSSPYCGAAYAV